MESIIASCITGGLALLGVVFTNIMGNKKFETQLTVSQAVTDTKIEELSKRMDKHNNLIERVFKLEQNEAVLSEKISVANHRIEDLEKDRKDDGK